MTSLGHSLVGTSIGVLCMPETARFRNRALFIAAMIAIASLPDWPIPGWGHHRLEVSHSLIVNLGLMLGLVFGARGLSYTAHRQYRLVVIGVLATWLSHFLLDALYVDSSMVLFWPVSDAGVSLPVPWLKTMPHVPPPFDREILMIFGFEGATFLPLLALAAFIRRWTKAAGKRHRHHPDSMI